MAKLKQVKGRHRPASASRLGQPSVSRDAKRYREKPWRRGYNTAAWKALVARVRVRDGMQCQQTGEMLTGSKHAPNSPVVDHKIPHRGDHALFFDIENLQLVSKAWHDKEKQRQERADL